MAVIVNMDIPKTCYECKLSTNFFGTLICGVTEKRANKSTCPLKSADGLVDSIENIPVTSFQTDGVTCYGNVPRTVNSYKEELMETIHKYFEN